MFCLYTSITTTRSYLCTYVHIYRLGYSPTREYGLPEDVFEDTQKQLSLNASMKFLRAASSDPSIFDDVGVRKRTKEEKMLSKNKRVQGKKKGTDTGTILVGKRLTTSFSVPGNLAFRKYK